MQITQLNLPESMIDLGIGQPDPALLPLAIMRQAARHRLDITAAEILQYGSEPGNDYFRHALAAFLTRYYQQPVAYDHLFVTAGATHALDLICTYFAKPGNTVFVEEPSYFLALRIFKDRGLKIVGLPMDSNGLLLDALKDRLNSQRPAFLYTIPTYHNPTGTTLSDRRRKQLVELCRTHGVRIVADEVYHLLNYTETPPPPMASYDNNGTVLSLGSFSKILAPGLRLGWIQARTSQLKRLMDGGLLKSSGGANPFISALVQSALELGLQSQHLDDLKAVYRRRSNVLSAAVARHLPNAVQMSPPLGGFFIWLRLSETFDTAKLRHKARGQQVSFQPGVNFSSKRQLRNCMRLCFVYYPEEKLIEGVRRLAAVIA